MDHGRHLPPLRSLQVFEAVGRHLNLTFAARELLVSESAVSQQVKGLERYLGSKLFVRLPRGIQLTPEGEDLLKTATRCLDDLSMATQTIRNGRAHKAVCLQVTAHFSTHWLAPRFRNFKRASPSIQLTLSEHSGPVDRIPTSVDIAVFWGNRPPADTVTEELFHVGYVPMCSPDLPLQPETIDMTDTIATVPLLAHSGSISWEQWCDWAGINPGPLARALQFDNYDLLIEATLEGNGLALITFPMFGRHFDEGRLIAPFGTKTAHPIRANICYRRDALNRPEVAQVRDWLVDEARRWREIQNALA